MQQVVFMEPPGHRSRHVPCEHCRKHRRKCTALTGTHCERCRRMALVCVYKFTRRPQAAADECPEHAALEAKRRRLVRSKRQQVREQVRQLEQLVADMEAELAAHGRRTSRSDAERWLTVSMRNGGASMRIEAPAVKTVSEVLAVLERARAYFCSSSLRSPLCVSERKAADAHLMIQRASPVEQVLRRFILGVALKKQARKQADPPPPLASSCAAVDHGHPGVVHLKRQLLRHYFSQTCYLHPRLMRTRYLPRLLDSPDSLLANSISAVLAHSLCTHWTVGDAPFTRTEFAAACQHRAYAQLREVLFDEPTVETLAALRYMSTCLMLELNVHETRRLVHLAWRMALLLKSRYLHVLQRRSPSHLLDEAETWRRLFYDVRSLELSLEMLFDDGAMDLGSLIASAKDVGCPMADAPAPGSAASDVYLYLTALTILPARFDSPFERQDMTCGLLYAGAIEQVSLTDMAHFENRLIEFWHTLPRAYVLTDAPLMEPVSMDRIQQCSDPSIKHLNLEYFMYWILIEMRIMRTNENDAGSAARDSQRALAIVSICCDAVAKLSLALYETVPCMVDVHWLVIITDLLTRFKNVADDVVRVRAEQNLQWIMYILRSFSRQHPPPPSMTPATPPSPPVSTSPPAFHGEMSRLITVRVQENSYDQHTP